MFSMYERYKGDDDLFAKPDPQAKAMGQGYLGDTEHISAANVNMEGGPDWSPDGEGYDVKNGWKQAGTSAFDKDVNRARDMGAAGQNRQGVQIGRGQIGESRGLQMGALGAMQTAAQGNAPSRAQALGQASTDNAMRANMAGAAGGRGAGGALRAMNQGQGAAAGQMAANNAKIADMRGAEMAQNQQQFATSAGAVRGQDVNLATNQAQLEQQQRQMNESRQQGYESRAFDTRKQQSQAAIDMKAMQDADARSRQQARDAHARGESQKTTDNISSAAMLGMMALSDENSKQNVRPMGSLSNLHRFMYRS